MKRALKIEIITHSYPPDFGAAPLLFEDLADFLLQQGCDVEVLTAMPYYPIGVIPEGYRKQLFVREERKGVTVRRHWLYPSNLSSKRSKRFAGMISMSLTMLRSLPHLLRRNPDILFIQTPPMMTPLLFLLCKRLIRGKVILNISDLWPEAIVDLGLMQDKGWVYHNLKKLQSWMYRRADALVAQSNGIKQHLEKEGRSIDLIYRVGVDTRLFQPKEYRDITENKPFRLVYTGVLNVAHGIVSLCQQINFKSLGAELHIYGDGAKSKELKEFLKENPDRGIVLHEVVSLKAIAELLPTYDAALISQRRVIRGTLPAKVYESMAAGLPIVFSGGGEAADIIEEHQCGYVSHPQNIEQLKEHIQELAQQGPEALAEMGQNGRVAALEHYDRRGQHKQLYAFFEGVFREKK
ncbi:glycosyltransferase family 4 protein [Algivirga pacifica]|uniref:Glycosyltransferase family 4 protein n=1 Tax=Algivirga pacifica TaxID=1162670 RepID=A0ABP9CVM8_9BACT